MWDELKDETEKPYFKKILSFLKSEMRHKEIAPSKDFIFRAFSLIEYKDVKVVILGQDPYPTKGHANGLAFAVNEGVKTPKSLANIFKEIESDTGKKPSKNDLLGWVDQGVFLLNTSLTTIEGETFAHKDVWQPFTSAVIQKLNERNDPIIFVLWGKPAQDKKKLITNPNHIIIETPHPSPLSAYRGFLGSKMFSKVNHLLEKMGHAPIDWSKA